MKLRELAKTFDNWKDFVKAVNNQIITLCVTNPEFRYTTEASCACSYNGPARRLGVQVGPDCNGCIFGQALQNLGWSDEGEMCYPMGICALISAYTDVPAPDYWRRVQRQQDMGESFQVLLRNHKKELMEV